MKQALLDLKRPKSPRTDNVKPKFDPMEDAWRNLIEATWEDEQVKVPKYTFLNTVKIQSVYNFLSYLLSLDKQLIKPPVGVRSNNE